jgi:hypothetical protein
MQSITNTKLSTINWLLRIFIIIGLGLLLFSSFQIYKNPNILEFGKSNEPKISNFILPQKKS